MTRESQYYPVFLDLVGRRCVVLGDNAIADAKSQGLRDAGADVVHHRRTFVSGDLAAAHLAIDATGDAVSQAAVRAEATTAHVLLNVVDAAQHCDWIAPAVVHRGPLQIAISTSGESPFLASTLRERLEVVIGEEWAALTTLLGRMRRRLRRHGVAREAQVRAYRRLLRPAALAQIASGGGASAAGLAAAIESAALHGTADAGGEVVLVGAGPGEPGLLTVAGRDALMNADVVVHDALVSEDVLRVCRSDARLIDAGKRAGRTSMTQDSINSHLVDAARAGLFVVRLKGGDPFVFGRGGEELAALRAVGIRARVIPGVSAAFAAAAAAGIPMTHRGVAASVAITTGQRAAGDEDGLERLARAADTLVVLMPGDITTLASRLSCVLGATLPAALIANATTPDQLVVRAPLGQLAATAAGAGVSAPSTLVCGRVVELLTDGKSQLALGQLSADRLCL